MLKVDQDKAKQFKRGKTPQKQLLRISVDEPLTSQRDVAEATVDFETFMTNYHRFVTLRKITNFIDEKLNKRMKKGTKINLHQEEQDS